LNIQSHTFEHTVTHILGAVQQVRQVLKKPHHILK